MYRRLLYNLYYISFAPNISWFLLLNLSVFHKSTIQPCLIVFTSEISVGTGITRKATTAAERLDAFPVVVI